MGLRVTGSSHTAETEETDLPDVSAHPCSDRHEARSCWAVAAKAGGQEGAAPGDKHVSSQGAASQRSSFCAQMADLYP